MKGKSLSSRGEAPMVRVVTARGTEVLVETVLAMGDPVEMDRATVDLPDVVPADRIAVDLMVADLIAVALMVVVLMGADLAASGADPVVLPVVPDSGPALTDPVVVRVDRVAQAVLVAEANVVPAAVVSVVRAALVETSISGWTRSIASSTRCCGRSNR